MILWLDHLDEGIPERDCYRLATVLPSTLMVTSAGLIETLDTGSGNYKESKITKGETFSYLDCITGDALVSLIFGEETNSGTSFPTRK